MDPFVRKLVLRLFDEGAPLSRNRHFHTFDSPEGKAALRVSKRLKALQRALEACRTSEGASTVRVVALDGGKVRVEFRYARTRGTHVATLEPWEYEVLRALPGVRDALG